MPPPPDHHARSLCSTDLHTYALRRARGQRKDRQAPSTRTSGTSRRRTELVRKAGTHKYLSFDPVTEHIASEMRLILRSGRGKGRLVLPSLPRRAARCLPPARSPAHSRMALHGLASTEADPEARRGPACVLSAGPTHRLPFTH